MSNPSDGMRYYMPLTRGSPKDGPTTSVFSVPRTQYSPQTEAVVKNLMRESRLTFTQKHVFDTILRNGKSLPQHPSQMMSSRLHQMYMQHRHRNKARSMGVQLLEPDDFLVPSSNLMQRSHIVQNRRSLEAIQASGDLEPLVPPKRYIPGKNDAEKERLAHKMAFGTDMEDPGKAAEAKRTTKPIPQKSIEKLNEERFEELIDEVQDRMQFLLTMDNVKKGKDYRSCIIGQINEKLQEMKKISPEREKDVRDCLQLERIDERLGSSFIDDYRRSSKFFEQ